MTTLTCTHCAHKFFTCAPEIFEGDIHLGCGGKYYREIEKELDDPLLQSTITALDIIFKETL